LDALGLPLLLVAALLALILIRARLARRPLGTGGAEVEDGFSFAAPAALTFWVAFVLAGIPVAVVAGIASPGGPEWGGPGVAVFFGIVPCCGGQEMVGRFCTTPPGDKRGNAGL